MFFTAGCHLWRWCHVFNRHRLELRCWHVVDKNWGPWDAVNRFPQPKFRRDRLSVGVRTHSNRHLCLRQHLGGNRHDADLDLSL